MNASRFLASVVIMFLPFALLGYAIVSTQLSMGPAGTHSYSGSVTALGFDATSTNLVDLNLGNLNVDGCFVESGGCKAGSLGVYKIPDTGKYPVLGAPISLTCNVEPVFKHIVRQSTCQIVP